MATATATKNRTATKTLDPGKPTGDHPITRRQFIIKFEIPKSKPRGTIVSNLGPKILDGKTVLLPLGPRSSPTTSDLQFVMPSDATPVELLSDGEAVATLNLKERRGSEVTTYSGKATVDGLAVSVRVSYRTNDTWTLAFEAKEPRAPKRLETVEL